MSLKINVKRLNARAALVVKANGSSNSGANHKKEGTNAVKQQGLKILMIILDNRTIISTPKADIYICSFES